MIKKILPTLLVIFLITLASCSNQEVLYVFNDHYIAMWAQSLEPYSVDIAFYGDSRVVLANWQEAYPNSDVVNLGIGGDTVEGTIQRIPLLEALDVKHCFLAIGANNSTKSDFSIARFSNNYHKLLDRLEELGITVYVNTIAGVTAENSEFNATWVANITNNVQAINEFLRNIEESHDVTLIDIAAGMNNADGTLKTDYSSDGIHFTDAGNQYWFDTLRPYVEAITE